MHAVDLPTKVLRESAEVISRDVLQGGCTMVFDATLAWVRTSRSTVLVSHRGLTVVDMGEYEAGLGSVLSELPHAIAVAELGVDAMGIDAKTELRLEVWTQLMVMPAIKESAGKLAPVPKDWMCTRPDGWLEEPQWEADGKPVLAWSSGLSDAENAGLLTVLAERCREQEAELRKAA